MAAGEQAACRSSAERAKVSVLRDSLLYLSRQVSGFRRGKSFASFFQANLSSFCCLFVLGIFFLSELFV